MNNTFVFGAFTGLLMLAWGCSNQNKEQEADEKRDTLLHNIDTSEVTPDVPEIKTKPSDFIPNGYRGFEEIAGDLDKDGVNDLIIVTKSTDSSKFVMHEFRGKLDINRKGIIILFARNAGYELGLKNDTCFSSENEDGGIYFAPDLSVEVKNGNLYISYAHGRYGYWSYTFRYKDHDFELIGYDMSDNSGPLVNSSTSINFLTKKRLDKVNTNYEAEGGDEVFKDKWKNIKVERLIKLSEIKDFNELDVTKE